MQWMFYCHTQPLDTENRGVMLILLPENCLVIIDTYFEDLQDLLDISVLKT